MTCKQSTIYRAMTIAGSDSGGGAGIQADLKTFSALGVYGTSVITAVTAQNTVGVTAIHDIPVNIIEEQLKAVLSDIGSDAIKIGMLYSTNIIEVVSKGLKDVKIPIVLDPVMIAKGGAMLIQNDAIEVLKKLLFPLTTLITPNILEAQALLPHLVCSVQNVEDMKKICHQLLVDLGLHAVLLKGGHLEGSKDVVDILLIKGEQLYTFSSPRVDTPNTHGTGCTLTSAITAELAKGRNLVEAVANAKEYVTGAIQNNISIGSVHGPLNHMWKFYKFPSTPYKFSQVLWNSISETIYPKILQLPFIQGVIDGTLPLQTFQNYLLQDSYYINQFARGLCIITAKIDNRYASTLLNSIKEIFDEEKSLASQFFKIWGIQDKAASVQPSSNCLLYTSYIINVAREKPVHEGVSAFLPCFWIHSEVGKYISKNAKLETNPYKEWISTYADPNFEKATLDFIEVVDSVSSSLSEDQKSEMIKHFRLTSLMEYKLWLIDEMVGL